MRNLDFIGAAVLAASVTAQDWSQVATFGPAGRQGTAMAATASGRVILFGGIDGSTSTNLADTWEWNNGAWTQLNPATQPPRRDGHAMGYDSVNDKIVMFGGEDIGAVQSLGDTWVFDPTTNDWSMAATPAGLTARTHPRMASDSGRGRVVMFGGAPLGQPAFDETWEWDFVNGWSQVTTATRPPARSQAAFSYDLLRGRVVLHGGSVTRTSVLNDTWEYDGVDWVEMLPDCPPGPRTAPRMAFSLDAGSSILFGGFDRAAFSIFDDVWEWDGRHWRRFELRMPVGGLVNGAMTSLLSGEAFVFSGTRFSGGHPMETWAFGDTTSASAVEYGCGCATGTGVLSLQGSPATVPALGTSYGLTVTNGSAATGILFGFAELPAPLDLDLIGAAGCRFYIANVVASASSASLTVSISMDPVLSGIELFAQAASVDFGSGSIATSNAIRLRVR